MTLLHVSDLHFRQPWFQWLREHAPNHDVLIISGDLLDHRRTDVSAQMDWVAEWLRASQVPVVVSSGNHDLEWDSARYRWQPAYWLRRLEPPVYADGAVLGRGGLRLAGIACTQRPRSVQADVWVVHTPPAGTAIARTSARHDRGDPLLTATIRREAPAWVCSGHVHDASVWHDQIGPTTVFNPGVNPHGRFPNHILIEPETGEARRISDRLQGEVSDERMQLPDSLAFR